MSQVYLETGHQALFAPGADLTAPVPVHRCPAATGG